MKYIEELQEMNIDEKKEHLKKLEEDCKDYSMGMSLSAFFLFCAMFSVPIYFCFADSSFSLQIAIRYASITCGIPAIATVLHWIPMKKYEKQYNKLDKEIKKEELESYEDKKSKEKIKEIEVKNSINYNIKQSEVEKKILSISEKELGLEKKKELLNLYKDNIEKLNELYETYELLDYLDKKGYSNSEIEYLIGEIEDTRTTEKAYQMKLNRGINDR